MHADQHAQQHYVNISSAATAARKHLQDHDVQIPLAELLSTCVDACERGCEEIRRVNAGLERGPDGALESAEYKIEGDPRSALTAADLAAHEAIVHALRREWPSIRIVSEEDESSSTSGTAAEARLAQSSRLPSRAPLSRERCPHLLPLHAAQSDICMFIDPLDGTREFVEGRVENVQALIGIAVGGHAVSGRASHSASTAHCASLSLIQC